jgi:nicotinate-nucleotide--dimethylbenzimidazole phosphoribosyltransferase
MTDTGQVPGEGLPESAGMVEQPGVPAHGAYTYLSETTAEDEDLLLLPGAQGAWGHEVAPPAPEPVIEAVHEPGAHEMSGRDSGSVDLGGVRLPDPTAQAPAPPPSPRRPLHLGPPIPDASTSPVRSLADRGPAGAPVRHSGPPTSGPEYLDVPQTRDTPPHGVTPWVTQASAQVPVGAGGFPAETVVPAQGHAHAAEALGAAQVQSAEQVGAVPGHAAEQVGAAQGHAAEQVGAAQGLADPAQAAGALLTNQVDTANAPTTPETNTEIGPQVGEPAAGAQSPDGSFGGPVGQGADGSLGGPVVQGPGGSVVQGVDVSFVGQAAQGQQGSLDGQPAPGLDLGSAGPAEGVTPGDGYVQAGPGAPPVPNLGQVPVTASVPDAGQVPVPPVGAVAGHVPVSSVGAESGSVPAVGAETGQVSVPQSVPEVVPPTPVGTETGHAPATAGPVPSAPAEAASGLAVTTSAGVDAGPALVNLGDAVAGLAVPVSPVEAAVGPAPTNPAEAASGLAVTTSAGVDAGPARVDLGGTVAGPAPVTPVEAAVGPAPTNPAEAASGLAVTTPADVGAGPAVTTSADVDAGPALVNLGDAVAGAAPVTLAEPAVGPAPTNPAEAASGPGPATAAEAVASPAPGPVADADTGQVPMPTPAPDAVQPPEADQIGQVPPTAHFPEAGRLPVSIPVSDTGEVPVSAPTDTAPVPAQGPDATHVPPVDVPAQVPESPEAVPAAQLAEEAAPPAASADVVHEPSPQHPVAGHATLGHEPVADTHPVPAMDAQSTHNSQPEQGPQLVPAPAPAPDQDPAQASHPAPDTHQNFAGPDAHQNLAPLPPNMDAPLGMPVPTPLDTPAAPAEAEHAPTQPEHASPADPEPLAPAAFPQATDLIAATPTNPQPAPLTTQEPPTNSTEPADHGHGQAPGEATHLPVGVPLEPHPYQPLGEFVPVEGSVPTTPHLAPTPPQPIVLPAEEPVATVPAPRAPDPASAQAAQAAQDMVQAPELVQQADDLDTRAADQEESTAAVEDVRQSTGPAAPAYNEAEREAVLRVMRERRDIRNGFRSDPIPHEVLLRVLEAAHTAPSVGHSQPWDFVVIRSAETRRSMHELAMRQRDAYAKSLPKGRAKQFKELKIEAILDTPVNIVVTADPTRGGRHTLGRHTQPQMAPYSAALAVENLWLAARAEGLGVGWVSFFDEREMVRALGLPEHLEVIAYLCVGYVDEFPDEPELMQVGWSKRRPLSWVVHEETYGRRALPGEDPHDLLGETVAQIRPLDAKALGEAWERQKRMTKPAGALGMLEIISAQLSGLSRQCPPPIPEPAAVAIFAGDHGVHAQGVTPWPQEVTAQMVANFLGGGAVCNAFAGQVGAEVCVVDVGVAADLPATPGLLPRKVRPGTSDMTTGPAMTREEAQQAIEVGIETARDLVAAGNKALLTGEMGIANTTASAALIAVFTDTDPSEVTGRGTGINDETLARKTEVVRRAIELHQPDPADPIGVLAAIGGLEHAAMVGLLLGGASLRTPVILDGVSAGAAALVARAIAPEVLAACIAGHRSAEPGHVAALNKLGLRPLVDLDLRLGEGTGALLALPLVQSTARAMHEVATFDSAGVTEK